jgi:hypothetical protein
MIQTIHEAEFDDFKTEIVLIPPTIRTIKFSTLGFSRSHYLAFPYTLIKIRRTKQNYLFGAPYITWVSQLPKDNTLCHFPLIPSVYFRRKSSSI